MVYFPYISSTTFLIFFYIQKNMKAKIVFGNRSNSDLFTKYTHRFISVTLSSFVRRRMTKKDAFEVLNELRKVIEDTKTVISPNAEERA